MDHAEQQFETEPIARLYGIIQRLPLKGIRSVLNGVPLHLLLDPSYAQPLGPVQGLLHITGEKMDLYAVAGLGHRRRQRCGAGGGLPGRRKERWEGCRGRNRGCSITADAWQVDGVRRWGRR